MLMYISKQFEDNIGATMHFKALREIWGDTNIFTIDLRPVNTQREDKYIAYGKYKNVMERLIRWSQGNMMFISNSIIEEICNLISKNNISIVFIEDSVFGNLVKKIKQVHPGVKVVSFYHDVKAALYRQWIRHKKPVDKIEYRIGIRQEKINQQYSDINIVFNHRDANLYKSYYNKPVEAIIPLSAPIPTASFLKETMLKSTESKILLFVGKNYYPNIIGIRWFCDNVFPKLPSCYTLQIIGKGLEFLKDELADSHVHVVGGVASLAEYYLQADIVIAPLFEGGGMKSKTVEAVSYGKCFIGTEESLFGFWEEMDDSIRNKTIFQCNTPEQWCTVLNQLADREILKCNEKVFDLFIKRFSYEASLNTFQKLFDQLMEKEA